MQTQKQSRLPISIRFAHLLNRALTWGLERQLRDGILSEGLADWDDMYRHEGPVRVTFRALRGIPAGIWARLDHGETTALPVAISISLVGIGGIGAGSLESAYPADIRRFTVLAAIGAFMFGVVLTRDPRRIVLRKLRLAGSILFAGFVGMAATIPTEHDWAYDAPYMETVIIDRVMAAGFAAVGIGFAIIVLASFSGSHLGAVFVGGAAIAVGTALFGITQVAWGVVAAPVDPGTTVVSVGVGLAALAFLHVMPRLRKLQIIQTERISSET